MTQVLDSQELSFDPGGSIFLPKETLVSNFLSLEGDPYDILAALQSLPDETFERTCDILQFSLLQSRGVERISSAIDDAAVAIEVERRMYFYKAIDSALGRTALRVAG